MEPEENKVEEVQPEHLKLSKWKQVDMPVDKSIISHLRKVMDFNRITKVQREVIPLFAKNKDVCVKACTGSGKTLAYLVSMLQILLNNEINQENPPSKFELKAIVLVPARELAIQVNDVLKSFIPLFPYLRSYCCIGGRKISEDIDIYRQQGANILIGTVGRIWDFLERGVMKLKTIKVLVIDEADLFFEQGNQVKLNQIIDKLPKERRTGLFSATMTSAIQNLVRAGLRNPYYVEISSYKDEKLRKNYEPFAIENLREEYARIEEFKVRGLRMKVEESKGKVNVMNEVPATLTNYYLVVDSQEQKLSHLLTFIKNKPKNVKIMIFFGTCASVEYYSYVLYHLFQKFLIPKRKILKLHRKIKQEQRSKVHQKFLSVSSGLLLTTDVSARGLDIPNIDWIIQFDPPQDSDQFVHRIGRTARAGKEGESLILLQLHEMPYVELLKSRRVTILEYKQDSDIGDSAVKECCRELMKSDKDIIDKSSNAFVAFIRYYKEHELKFIFAFNQLSIGAVANAFALYRLPRIKEILGKNIEGFTSEKIDVDEIKYLSK